MSYTSVVCSWSALFTRRYTTHRREWYYLLHSTNIWIWMHMVYCIASLSTIRQRYYNLLQRRSTPVYDTILLQFWRSLRTRRYYETKFQSSIRYLTASLELNKKKRKILMNKAHCVKSFSMLRWAFLVLFSIGIYSYVINISGLLVECLDYP